MKVNRILFEFVNQARRRTITQDQTIKDLSFIKSIVINYKVLQSNKKIKKFFPNLRLFFFAFCQKIFILRFRIFCCVLNHYSKKVVYILCGIAFYVKINFMLHLRKLRLSCYHRLIGNKHLGLVVKSNQFIK